MTVIAPTTTSPNVGNYRVGRGFMQMQLQGEDTFKDMGNITSMTFVVKPTLLDHYSSRVGVQIKDRTVVTRLDAAMVMVLEEITARNMALALLGIPSDSGDATIDIMTNPLFYCSLNFTDTNVTGPQWQAYFPSVLITPSKPIEMIAEGSGNWMGIQVDANVQHDQVQGFGWFTGTNFSDL